VSHSLAAEPAYLRPEQLAAMLQVSTRSIYRLVAKHPDIPALNVTGGALRFPRERLERWLRDREQGRAQPKSRPLAIVKAEAR
jgi:excisionase family DNA binding protein